jgi:hypothetical protein
MGSMGPIDPNQPTGMEMDQGETGVTWNPAHTLAMRLLLAQRDVKSLDKDVDVKASKSENGKGFGGYKGISAAQVVAHAKEILTKNGILYTSDTDKDFCRRNGNKTEVWYVGRFENVDNPSDYRTKGTWGEGNDNSSHGYQKATTNAEKIILGKMLMMTTHEDEGEDIVTVKETDSPAIKEAQAYTDAAIKSWADAFKRAIDGCKTLQDLKQIRAENSHMMRSDSVPQVTKDFFIDRIAELEGMLQ